MDLCGPFPSCSIVVSGMLGGTSLPVPFSIWSWTHCPLNLCKSFLNFVILSASAASHGDKFQEFTALCGKKDFFCLLNHNPANFIESSLLLNIVSFGEL